MGMGLLLAMVMLAVGAMAGQAWAGDKAYTPAKGSAERTAVMDAIRRDVAALGGMKVVFMVEHLKVAGSWAYTSVMPQSPDGKSKYEGFSALLQKVGGKWQVVHVPVFDPDGPELSNQEFIAAIMKRFPKAPAAIF